jgi:hypothetical protein
MEWFFTTMFSGIGALLGASIMAIIQHKFIQKRENQHRHFERKIESYRGIVYALLGMLREKHPSGRISKKSTEKTVKALFDFKDNVLLWGSKDLIYEVIAYQKMLTLLGEKGSEDLEEDLNVEIFSATESLLRGIRKDLGHDDTEVGDGKILELMTSYNLDEIMEVLRKDKK